mmetsp:Transcript_30686/g.68777  ORF Transcript_30686/g.68777 Transcript_30686/m.68777 type:complete len:261 (-) Transcript_30686:1526-2308(-)
MGGISLYFLCLSARLNCRNGSTFASYRCSSASRSRSPPPATPRLRMPEAEGAARLPPPKLWRYRTFSYSFVLSALSPSAAATCACSSSLKLSRSDSRASHRARRRSRWAMTMVAMEVSSSSRSEALFDLIDGVRGDGLVAMGGASGSSMLWSVLGSGGFVEGMWSAASDRFFFDADAGVETASCRSFSRDAMSLSWSAADLSAAESFSDSPSFSLAASAFSLRSLTRSASTLRSFATRTDSRSPSSRWEGSPPGEEAPAP